MKPRYVAALVSFSLLGQQPAQEVKFSVTSRLVVVSVIAKDREGKPIEGIKAADFSVIEDNKPQKISVFDYQRLDDEAAYRQLPQLPGQPAEPPKPATPATTPDAPASPVKFRDRRLLVLFFDFSSMPPEDQIRAQGAALKFLDEHMTPADVVSIMTFTGSLKVAQEFTGDRDLLNEAIRKFKIGDSSELAADATTAADADEESGAYTADDTEFNVFNTDRKLGALESAAKMLAALPEKKALVYFSSGVGRTGVENQSQLRATVNAAVRANLSFYPVDARGLVASAPAGNASEASPRGTGVFSGQTQRQRGERFQGQQETLYTLAADTGGKALLDTNDLALGIVQAQRDISSYYILGYYSSNAAEDGRFRRIRVKLDRDPQAKLDFRSGYFAPKQWRNFDSSDKERQLEEALMLGDPVTDLPVALEVNYFRLLPGSYFVPVAVKIPGSALELARKKGSEETELDFIGEIKTDKGRPSGSLRDMIKVKLKSEQSEGITQRHLQYDTGFVLSPGAYTLRFLARENQTGKMGTFETKFTVPDLDHDQGYLRLSSVVWSNQREPLAAAVGAAQGSRRLTGQHPLVSDGKKLVPSITRVFRKDQNLYVYFEIYDPAVADGASGETRGNASADVRASVAFYSGNLKAFETEPVKVTQARRRAARIQLQVALAALEPGRYVCQVNVVDDAGRKFGFARAAVVLLPPQAH